MGLLCLDLMHVGLLENMALQCMYQTCCNLKRWISVYLMQILVDFSLIIVVVYRPPSYNELENNEL